MYTIAPNTACVFAKPVCHAVLFYLLLLNGKDISLYFLKKVTQTTIKNAKQTKNLVLIQENGKKPQQNEQVNRKSIKSYRARTLKQTYNNNKYSPVMPKSVLLLLLPNFSDSPTTTTT